MTFIHSFQAEPLLKSKFYNISSELKVILINYAYSVECIHKFGHSIELYTDTLGSEFLKPIAYDKVHIITNNDFNVKIKTLQDMSLDQILIEGDVFLEKPIIFTFLKNFNSDVVVTANEYIDNLNEEFSIFSKFQSEEHKLSNTFKLYDISLLKFNDEFIKQEYLKQYIDSVKNLEPEDFTKNIESIPIYEKCVLTSLVNTTNCSLEMIKTDDNTDESFLYKIGFCHLGKNKEVRHNYYLRKLQTINYQLSLELENHYIFLMENFIPRLQF